MKAIVTFEFNEYEENLIHSWIESSWGAIQDDPDYDYIPSELDILKNFAEGEIVTNYAVVLYIRSTIEEGLDLYRNGKMDKVKLTQGADHYESDLVSDSPNLDHDMVVYEKFYCADNMSGDDRFVCDLVDGNNTFCERIGEFDSLEECQKAVNRHYRKEQLWSHTRA